MQLDGYGLTTREKEVCVMVEDGKTTEEIAAGYEVSQQAVRHYLLVIYQKMGVSSRLELVNLLRS